MRERVLIVEDNKTLAKLIAKKMEARLDMEVVVAHTLAEAEAAIEDNDDFFVALLDLNLPDAPNGEVVDFVLSKNIVCIVLTGSFDETTRAAFMAKPIIDYIVKANMDNINYIFHMIARLRQNREYRVMIVEPHRPTRDSVAAILKSQLFRVIVAAHGEEAMSYLNDYSDIGLILTADEMPALGGYELLREIRENSSQSDLGVILLTDGKDEMATAKFLKNGANDFIKKPFSKEEIIARVHSVLGAMESNKRIERLNKVDEISLLSTRSHFLSSLAEMSQRCVLAILSIDDFSSLNTKHGLNAANAVIAECGRLLRTHFGAELMGRLMGGEFALLMSGSFDEAVKRLVQFKSEANASVKIGENSVRFSMSIGISEFSGDGAGALDSCYKALLKANAAGKNRVEICDS